MSTVTPTRPGAEVAAADPGRVRHATPLARAGIITVLVAVALLWLTPLLWAVKTSFTAEAETTAVPLQTVPDSGFTGAAYSSVLGNGDLLTWFWNSTIVAVAVTVLTVAVSSLAAYGFSRCRFRGRGLLFALTVVGIMVPPQILVVPLYREVVAMGLADTYWGIILPQVAVPAMVFILKAFFDGIPRELEEAARVDGAGSLRIFWQIVLPLSKSILAAVAIFVFIGAWNNFLWPFIIISDPDLMTLPVGIVQVQSSFGVRYAQVLASALLAGLPLIVVFMLFQRQIIRGVATTGLGGQ